MNNEEIRKIVEMVCNSYVDTIMTAIEEDNTNDFPITIACANFIEELKIKGVELDLIGTFEDKIIDKIFKEINDYLGK